MRICLSLFSVLLLATTVVAAPVTYTNGVTFSTDAANAGILLTLDNLNTAGDSATPIARPLLSINNNVAGALGSDSTPFYAGSTALAWSPPPHNLNSSGITTFTFNDPTSAFGFTLYDLGTVGATNFELSVDGGANWLSVYAGFTGGVGAARFAGVIDTANPFTSVQLRNSVSGDYLEIDDLQIGAAVVPEPASMLAFGIVGAAGAVYGWRRRRVTQG